MAVQCENARAVMASPSLHPCHTAASLHSEPTRTAITRSAEDLQERPPEVSVSAGRSWLSVFEGFSPQSAVRRIRDMIRPILAVRPFCSPLRAPAVQTRHVLPAIECHILQIQCYQLKNDGEAEGKAQGLHDYADLSRRLLVSFEEDLFLKSQ